MDISTFRVCGFGKFRILDKAYSVFYNKKTWLKDSKNLVYSKFYCQICKNFILCCEILHIFYFDETKSANYRKAIKKLQLGYRYE